MKSLSCFSEAVLAGSLLALLWLGNTLGWGPSLSWAAEGKFNVLMICVDDLRPELGYYGLRTIKTPR
ncbi:MAG: hypothetical protein NZ899_00315 [Thermoguttaceae bacterium]|nr:hypothetical protein [Thermoguttaceae bacterium]MDW8077339.1 hypothetical protein [Thermoguttaceae bacterium]